MLPTPQPPYNHPDDPDDPCPPTSRDPLLFTPGPLTTSRTVKQAMLRDVGSRDAAFIATVARIRERLLSLAGVSQAAGYEAVLMQGSGTFGIESVITSAVPRDGKLLVLANGAYGERIARIADVAGIERTVLRSPEDDAGRPRSDRGRPRRRPRDHPRRRRPLRDDDRHPEPHRRHRRDRRNPTAARTSSTP